MKKLLTLIISLAAWTGGVAQDGQNVQGPQGGALSGQAPDARPIAARVSPDAASRAAQQSAPQSAQQGAPGRLEAIAARLALLEQADPNYAREVEEFSVTGLPLPELLRNIASVYDVNINVRGAGAVMVTSNFARVRITDLILFLCREYNLDAEVVGNIVSVFPVPVPAPGPRVVRVSPGDLPGTVSYDLEQDRLSEVMKLMTAVGRVNFIIPNALNGRTVSGHGRDMPMDDAVVAIASANGLAARKNGHGIWEIADAAAGGTGAPRRQSAFDHDQLYVDSLGMITAQIAAGNVQEIITDLCETQGWNYFFLGPVAHTVPLNVKEVTFETLLGIMFSGTGYGYYLEDGIYIFGTFSAETLGSVRVIPLVYRSVAKLEEVIPAQLKTGLELKTFVDLNSIIASGDQRRVLRVESFLRSIDVRVPLVTIEVMIVDVTKTDIMETGLGLGIGETPAVTSGTLSPGVDMTLGAGSVNSIIDRVNGLGSVNLGRVGPQFYMNLKMLEDNGTIKLHSTPRLSTLNGNPARLTSGETTYYKEVQTNYWGSQTPTPSESYTWKQIEAKLTVEITPFVSADGMITLNIKVEQKEFADTPVETDGPLGTNDRSFESMIRVQNGEMVLLGGIDRNSRVNSSSGLPFIARIPVLKWLFGKAKREKRDHKLNVFIKPTLVE